MARELGKCDLTLVRLWGVCLLAVIYLPACTHQIQIGEPELPSPLIQPLPLKAGVIFDPDLSDYEFVVKKWGDIFRFQPGEASQRVITQILGSTFSEIIILTSEELTDYSAEAIDARVSVAIEDFFAHVDPVGETERVEITYAVTIEAPDSGTVANLDFHGQSKRPAYLDWGEISISKYYGRLTREAIFDAATSFMIEFRDSPDVKQWLIANGAYREHLGIDASSDGESISRSFEAKHSVRVAIFSDREDFRTCLTDRLTDSPVGIQVLDEQQIRNAFYPWMIDLGDPEAAEWAEVNGAAPLVRQRIAEIGITHIVTTAVNTDSRGYEEMPSLEGMWNTKGVKAFGIPLITPYGTGIFGVLVANESTDSAVVVYALDPQRDDASFEQSASGKIYQIVPGFPVLPVMGKETDALVCEAVADELVERLH